MTFITALTCGEPPIVPHAFWIGNRRYGDSVHLECIEGYTLVGNGALMCNNGTWMSDNLPHCQREFSLSHDIIT